MTVATIYSGANDGEMRGNNATYATARSGAGTIVVATTAAFGISGQELYLGQYYCYELGFDFDTSGIPANAIISSAVLSLWCLSTGATSSGAAIHRARLYDWGATLTSADFIPGANLSGNPLLAHIAQSAVTASAYNNFVDDAMAANIVKGGHTRILVTSDRLEAGTAPASGQEYVIWRMIEQAGTANDPFLTITYTLPGRSQAVVIA